MWLVGGMIVANSLLIGGSGNVMEDTARVAHPESAVFVRWSNSNGDSSAELWDSFMHAKVIAVAVFEIRCSYFLRNYRSARYPSQAPLKHFLSHGTNEDLNLGQNNTFLNSLNRCGQRSSAGESRNNGNLSL